VAPGGLKANPRILGGIAAALVVILAASLGAPRVLRHLEFFRVRRIEISGARYLSPNAVRAALRLGPTASVFDDLGVLQRRVGAIAGVERAAVGRRLPGTLTVSLIESEPVALAPRAGGLAPIDARGRVLPYDPTRAAPDLPIAGSADSLVARVLGAVRDYDPALFAGVTSAARVADDVALELDGHRVWLAGSATAEDIRAVAAVAQDLARQQRTYQELDGRFAGQVIVRGAARGGA
jgi:cell division septal protein FtsQ